MSIYAVNGKIPVAAWIPSRDTAGNGTSTLTDLVGGNNGTLTNMDAATDWVADTGAGGVSALDFDGVNDRVITVDGANLSIAGNLSMSLWCTTTTTTGLQVIAGRTDEAASFPQNYAIIRDGNLWRAGMKTGVIYPYVTGGTAVINQWVHLVLVKTATDLLIYFNNAATSIVAAGTPDTSGTQRMMIGAQHSSAVTALKFFSGRIDDVRLFNTALTASDVAVLYNAGNGRGSITNNSTIAMGIPI